MNPWITKLAPLTGRKNTPLGPETPVSLSSSDYSGPADGDFARYVEQLLSNAESARRTQTHAPVHDARAAARAPKAPAGGKPSARRNQAQDANNAASDSLARLRSQSQDVAGDPALKVGLKLVPLLIWLPVVVALFFWQGAAMWLGGLVLLASLLFNMARKALARQKG